MLNFVRHLTLLTIRNVLLQYGNAKICLIIAKKFLQICTILIIFVITTIA